MDIRERILEINENIASAARQAGRDPDEIKLIAVTKTVGEAPIREAAACGICAAGENRVQELTKKLPLFESLGMEIHLIGQLQTNKVKYVIGNVSLIHSVDRLSLAGELERVCALKNAAQDILIEVNIGGEPQKGGVSEPELVRLLEGVSAFEHVNVKGLMCVPPSGAESAKRCFSKLRELAFRTASLKIPDTEMRELSMGMSGDYIEAIGEGATMVRVGSLIFGSRS